MKTKIMKTLLTLSLITTSAAFAQDFDDCLTFSMRSDHDNDVTYLCLNPLVNSLNPAVQIGGVLSAELYALDGRDGHTLLETIQVTVTEIDHTHILGRWAYLQGESDNYNLWLRMGSGSMLTAIITYPDGHRSRSNRFASEPRPQPPRDICTPRRCR